MGESARSLVLTCPGDVTGGCCVGIAPAGGDVAVDEGASAACCWLTGEGCSCVGVGEAAPGADRFGPPKLGLSVVRSMGFLVRAQEVRPVN